MILTLGKYISEHFRYFNAKLRKVRDVSPPAEFVILNISPEVTGNLSEGILELVVCLAISQDKISGMHSSAIKGLIRKSILNKVLLFPDHIIADLGLDVPLTKSVSNFAEPCLTSD